MRTLEDFQLPNDGEIAICEINGHVHSMNYDFADVKKFTNTVENFPQVLFTRDLLHPVVSGDEGRSSFLSVDVPFLKQLTQIYYEQGTVPALQTAVSHKNCLVSKCSCFILDVLHYINSLRLIFNPNLRYSGPTLIHQYAQTRNWTNTTIRSIVWHPHTKKLALITCDDCVSIFHAGVATPTILLRCKLQKHVTCAAWRPLSNTQIAVGHENGIIVWNYDPSSSLSKPSLSNSHILQRSDHRPVISLAWSPNGDKLISAAACDNTILVWDVELDRTSSLKRPGGVGNILVKWSPTGEKLFSCSNSLVFRIWDCRSWENERWTILSGRIQTACWANAGTTLVFATNTEPIIYAVIVKNDLIFTSDSDSSATQAVPLIDASKVDIDGVIVGGLIQCMESDPKGKHVAVLFQETDSVAVFRIMRQPVLQLVASSLVMGLADEKPSSISFVQDFEAGSCLSIAWSSGRIQYFPIIYTDLTHFPDHHQVISSVQNSFTHSF